MKFQDVHVHLQDSPPEVLKQILSAAQGCHVQRFFCNATTTEDCNDVKQIADRCEQIIPFYGIHPWYVDRQDDDWEKILRAFVLEGRGCGIGEIGLDRGPKAGSQEKQVFIFRAQVKIAGESRRPFILHCVHAWDTVLEILRTSDLNKLPFIAHGFSGSEQLAGEIINLGGYLAVSFRLLESKHRKVLNSIPKNRILIETDFPYHKRSSRELPLTSGEYFNVLKQTYQDTAGVMGIGIESLADQVWENGSVFINNIVPTSK